MMAGPGKRALASTTSSTSDIDFDGGTTAEFNSSTGFLVGIGYELSNHFEIGANFTYDERDYDARLAGDEPGEDIPGQGQH